MGNGTAGRGELVGIIPNNTGIKMQFYLSDRST